MIVMAFFFFVFLVCFSISPDCGKNVAEKWEQKRFFCFSRSCCCTFAITFHVVENVWERVAWNIVSLSRMRAVCHPFVFFFSSHIYSIQISFSLNCAFVSEIAISENIYRYDYQTRGLYVCVHISYTKHRSNTDCLLD